MSFPYIIQGNNITVVVDNNPHTISQSHLAFTQIKEAIRAQNWDQVRELIEPKKVLINAGKGNISVKGDVVYWRGQELHNALSRRLVPMLRDGFNVDPLVNFMDNLMENPSKQSVDELYGFLEKNNLPITADGHFLAYKKVAANGYDVHSGTVPNLMAHEFSQEELDSMPMACGIDQAVTVSISDNKTTVVEMLRNQVDDNRNNHCSQGLHFCSQSYLGKFGGSRVMLLKINPRDVVSIPTDYNGAKGRCCRYEIVGEVGLDIDDEKLQAMNVD